MNKFLVIFKKELKELLTLQMILPMIVSMMIFVLIGNIVGSEVKKAESLNKIIINDMDSSTLSNSAIDSQKSSGFEVLLFTKEDTERLFDVAKENKISTIIVIPNGFEKSIAELKTAKIQNYTVIQGLSFLSLGSSGLGQRVMGIMNEYLSNTLISEKTNVENPSVLKYPIVLENMVTLGDKTANISMDELAGFLNSQTMFIPIIVFIIIMMASQTVTVSVASEKENKTLETLLSTPLKRVSIVAAKMSAAGIISLLMAAVYMFGMNYYLKGITGGALDSQSTTKLADALNTLGMNFAFGDYILIGLSIFLSILIALAISVILGVYSEDVKKAQGLLTPLIFLVMIPYFISMFIDINAASLTVKILVYAIPFSHTFLISQNIFFNKYFMITGGIIYQILILIIFITIAARIFASDRVLTAKINFEKKKIIAMKN